MIDMFLVHYEASLRDVLQVISRNASGIAFVIDENGVLCGVITDGDIRRALLAGATLETPAHEVMTADCLSLPYQIDRETIFSKLNKSIRIIPLVDGQNRPIDYASTHRHHKIPYAEPSLGGNEFKYVTECLETNWISSQGGFINRFEQEFAAFSGAKHTVVVSSGTAALHLALVALGVGPGDEVIIPDLTFSASAATVLHAGATPVLVDVSEDTWCLDPDAAAAAVTPRTRAVMPVHLYGQPAEMNSIMALAARHDLFVIEDAAEALGATYDGRQVGTFGDAGAFSFFGNKLITTGEGGMITFRDAATAERARLLRDHGMDPKRRYWHVEAGFNYRMTNLQAAIGVAQLERIDGMIEKKLEIGALYRAELGDIPYLTLPITRSNVQNIYWFFSVLFDGSTLGMDRDVFASRLALNAVVTRPLFYPLHQMPPYQKFADNHSYRNSIRLSEQGISLPSAVTLKTEEISHVTAVIRHIGDTHSLMNRVGIGTR